MPTWLSVNPNTGIISGTPDNDDTGLLYISAIAIDNTTSKQYYDSFYLTVDNVNDAPTLTGDFDSNIVVGATSVGGSVVGNDVDEYQDIYDATNWTDYDRDESINGADTYTRTNTNSDTEVYTYLKNDDDTETKTWDYILANGDWYKQVRNYDADGDFISHYTQSNGVDYYSQGSYDLNDNLTLVYSGDVATSLGLLYYDISGTKTTSSNGIDTSYSGVALTSEGRQLISTMDGVDEESNANIIRYTQTGLGIDSLIKDGVQLSIEDQQGIYGFLELTQDSEWIYTLDNTDPDTVAIATGVSEVDSFLVTLFDGYTSTTQTIDINIINANIITSVVSNDNLQGTAGIDHITTLGGSNTISALSGNDIINLSADSTWSSGYATLNVSNDASVGTDQKIILTGLNHFSDVIDGGADVDTLNLTTGNDAFFIDDIYSDTHTSLDSSLVSTTQGINSTARIVNLEVINAGIGDDIVDLTSSNFILANAIEINGEDGNDILWGSNGNDTINGGEGDDTIFGGTGSDTLTGGNGTDIFQFTATAGSDVITDFNLTDDSIQLYYRATDKHTNADLDLTNGVLTWDVDNTNTNIVIDLSTTVDSSNLSEFDVLISFVEIV